MEELKNLCLIYGFEWYNLGRYIMIKSKRDTWALEEYQFYNNMKIQLKHMNNYHASTLHFQGKFQNLSEIFAYIEGHDNKYLTRYNKTFVIKDLLEVVGV